tara:strand:- start:1128 stop:1418 length:291 start_codon:yes stop_codon:yes gene_type:complete
MKITKQKLKTLVIEAINKQLTAYVRATGNNRSAGGTPRWLKIRSIEPFGSHGAWSLMVKTQYGTQWIELSDENHGNLEFKLGSQPVSWDIIKNNFA